MTDDSESRSSEPEIAGATNAPVHDETLLRVYEKLRDEITQYIRIGNRASLRGVVAIGAIVGYAVSSEIDIVVGLVPLAMAYVFVKSVEVNMWVSSLGRQVAEIEERLSPPESPVRWEIQRGGAVGGEESQRFWNNRLKMMPGVARVTLAFLGYGAAIGYTMAFAWPDQNLRVGGIRVTPIWGWIGYTLLTLLVVVVAAVYVWHSVRVAKGFEENRLET